MAEGRADASRRAADAYTTQSEGDSDSESRSQSSDSWLAAQPLLEEQYFPRIVAIFYSIFHPTQGPTVVYQVPEGSIASAKADAAAVGDGDNAGEGGMEVNESTSKLPDAINEEYGQQPGADFNTKDDVDESAGNDASRETSRRAAAPIFDFKTLSEYIIPKAALCGRLLTCSVPAPKTANQRGQSYKILSHPVILYDQAKYPRNSFVFNLAFVFDGRADTRPYEPVVRKCARELTNMEQASSFLSKSQFRMYEVIEQLFEDLNTYYESFVAIPDAPHSKYVTTASVDDKKRRESSDASRNWADLLRKQHTASNANARLHRAGYGADRSSQSSSTSQRPAQGLFGSALGMSAYDEEEGKVANNRRPPAKRASTDVPVVELSAAPTSGAKSEHISQRSEDMHENDVNSSKDARPGLSRAKTSAATAKSSAASSATVMQAARSPQFVTSPQFTETRRSSAASLGLSMSSGAMLRSMSIASRGSMSAKQGEGGLQTGDDTTTEPHDYDRSILSPSSDAVSNTESQPYPKSEANTDYDGIGGAANASVLAPGKREPPHGLGRTVRDAINVKLFPTHANPPEVHDWDVPVTLLDLKSRLSDNWDLSMIRVLPLIDGINHVKRIAQLADADLELTRQCIEHLLYYRCIIIIDTFQFTNIYTVRPTIALLAEDDVVISECASYVTKGGYQAPSWPKLLRLYSSLRPSITINDWIDDNDIDELGVDTRRFITFGVIKGFLRRVHRYPVLLAPVEGDECALVTRDDSASRSRSRDRLATLRGSEGQTRKQSSHTSERPQSTAAELPVIVWDTARSLTTPKGSARRKYGVQLAQGQAHHHRQTQATVMDAAHIAFDAAKELAEDARRRDSFVSGYAYPGGGSSGVQQYGRTPLSRNASSSATIRAGPSKRPSLHAINAISEGDDARGIPMGGSTGKTNRLNSRHARRGSVDGKASTKTGEAQAVQIPPELVMMLDGMHPDDAFTVRFGKSWNEILRMLHIIGHSPHVRSASALAGHGRAGSSGAMNTRGRSSVSSEAGASGFARLPANDDGAGDSTFYKLSGIWGVEGGTSGILQTSDGTPRGGVKTSKPADDRTSAQTRTSRAPGSGHATPSATVTFPSLPRYRASGADVNASAQQSNHSSFGRRGAGPSNGKGREGSVQFDPWLLHSGSGSTDYADKSGGQDEAAFSDRRRSAQGNLGRIQIIVK